MKELKSFFDNGVWTFQTTKEADPARTLTSRILLKWSKNADGTPRAKARLVVRGYADADISSLDKVGQGMLAFHLCNPWLVRLER